VKEHIEKDDRVILNRSVEDLLEKCCSSMTISEGDNK